MTYYPDAINQYPDRVDKNESGYAITAEYFNVPTSSPYTIYLDHIPKDSDTTKIYASGNHADEWTEVLVAPTATKEFYINYDVGSILFYSGDTGTAVEAEYETLGDDIMAEHMNNMQNEVYGIVSTLGLNVEGIYNTLSQRLSNIYADASINASQVSCVPFGAGTYSTSQGHIDSGDDTYAVDANPHGISWDILFNTVGTMSTQSGDINIRSVGGDVVFASGRYMAIGTSGPDQDQFIYFYDNTSTDGQWIKWDDGDDRFELSDDLYVHGNVSASGKMTADDVALKPTTTITIASSTSRGKDTADYVCDGTDDNVQIQSAIDSITKGRIVFLEGDFILSSTVSIKPDIWIQGCGQNITFFKTPSSSNFTMFEYDSSSTDQGFVMSDFTAFGYENDGSFIDTGAGSGYLQDVRLENLYVDGFSSACPILIKDPWGFRCIKVIIEQCAGDAITVTAGDTASGAMFTNCKIMRNGGNGIVFNGIDYSSIIGCEFSSGYTSGGGDTSKFCISLIDCNKILIDTNTFRAVGSSNIKGSGIILDTDCDTCHIVNNTFNGDSVALYGVVLSSATPYNIVANNLFVGFATSDILDNGLYTYKICNQSSLSPVQTSTFPYGIHVGESISFGELSSDPTNPNEGNSVIWMSDGTDGGNDGDIMIKVAASGVVRTGTLVDFGSLS